MKDTLYCTNVKSYLTDISVQRDFGVGPFHWSDSGLAPSPMGPPGPSTYNHLFCLLNQLDSGPVGDADVLSILAVLYYDSRSVDDRESY